VPTPVRGRLIDSRGAVAVVLAFGLATAINLITLAILWDAIFHHGGSVDENSTQILTTIFTGIIGILGAYIGFRAGRETVMAENPAPTKPIT
jgi:sulfite exporter TauE/SafE